MLIVREKLFQKIYEEKIYINRLIYRPFFDQNGYHFPFPILMNGRIFQVITNNQEDQLTFYHFCNLLYLDHTKIYLKNSNYLRDMISNHIFTPDFHLSKVYDHLLIAFYSLIIYDYFNKLNFNIL